MDNLTDLTLSNVRINDYSTFDQLQFRENIRSLGLGGNNIKDISFLSNFTNLDGLSIDDNQIEDISVLSGLTNLFYLEMTGNNISDISPLANLVNLQQLWIDDDTYNNNPETINILIDNGCRINPD